MSNTNETAQNSEPPERTLLGQPMPLYMLFFSELWERFSFYGMRALLTLYLAQELFLNLGEESAKDTAFGIFAAYGALVYATPLLGGILADQVMGQKRATMLGAVLMAIGHFVMAIENEFFLYVALAFLIVGNGFFKPNISTMVGGLYKQGDPRRDVGFTIFYMGINTGAFLAPLLCGYLGETYGWSWGFGLAGVGMLVGLAVFGRGQGALGENGDPPDDERYKKYAPFVVVGAFLSVGLFAVLVWQYKLMSYILTPFVIAVVLFLLVEAFRRGGEERDRLLVVLILLFFMTVFWAFFEQAGSSLTLFTDGNVDRTIAGQELKASMFTSANAFFVMLLALPFSYLWAVMGKHNIEPSTPVKFAAGLALLGFGFLLLGWSDGFASVREVTVADQAVTAATVPLIFLIGGYFFHTVGELCLSPVGLSMVTKLAPKNITAMVMGAWFMSSAVAHHIAGIIAKLTTVDTEANITPGKLAIDQGIISSADDYSTQALQSFDNLAQYTSVFEVLGWIAVACGVFVFAISPLLKRWMHGVR